MARARRGGAVIEVRIAHALGRDGAKQRLEALARSKSVDLALDGDGYGGTVEKALPFLGKASARVAIEERAIVVTVLEVPRFLSEATLRRGLEDELGRALA
jgi:hypothetical protein